jgi:hypothetical protein
MGPNLRFCPTGCREMVRAHTSNQRYRNNYIRFHNNKKKHGSQKRGDHVVVLVAHALCQTCKTLQNLAFSFFLNRTLQAPR